MTQPPTSQPSRLTPGQTLGWLLAFIVLAGLIGMFFAYATAARPVFEAGARTVS